MVRLTLNIFILIICLQEINKMDKLDKSEAKQQYLEYLLKTILEQSSQAAEFSPIVSSHQIVNSSELNQTSK